MSDAYMRRLADHIEGVKRAGRWTPGRKLALVNLLKRGALTVQQACDRYGLSAEEIDAWRKREAAHGSHGLAVTKRRDVR